MTLLSVRVPFDSGSHKIMRMTPKSLQRLKIILAFICRLVSNICIRQLFHQFLRFLLLIEEIDQLDKLFPTQYN